MARLAPKHKLHLWFPDIFDFKGGIQVYSAFLLRAIRELYSDICCDVFLKNDLNSTDKGSELPQTHFHFAGQWPLSFRTYAFAAQISRAAMWQRPDLIIGSHLNFASAAHWVKRFTGVPYWIVAHGVEAWEIKQEALCHAVQQADRILAVSHYTRGRLLESQNISPDRISVLPNTFSAEQFMIAPKPAYLLERYGLRESQPIILTVSRLVTSERYKGYDQILKALPQIRKSLPETHYIIVGKGDDRLRLESMISGLNLQSCVTLAGYIKDEELCNYYNLCDVFAMPSKREGFGIVYLEALACGKPTLAGNKDGAVDALCHGELGALVDPDNTEEIAQTLIGILKGTYVHPIMYRPEILRQKVSDTFGFQSFKKTLFKSLQEFFADQRLSDKGSLQERKISN